MEGSLPASVQPSQTMSTGNTNKPNFERVGDPYKGSIFSNSTDLVAKGKGLATTEQPIQGVKAIRPDLTGMASRLGSTAVEGAKKIAGPALAVVPEAINTAKDVFTSGVDAATKAARVSEGATRVASTLAGGQAGAAVGALGGPAAPVTVPLGAVAGGALGYIAPDYAKDMYNAFTGRNVQLPSETISNIRDANQNSSDLAQAQVKEKVTNPPSITPSPSKQQMTVPTESQALGAINRDRVAAGNFGQSGKIQYTLDDEGKPIRTDTSTNTSSRLGGISTMGPNGTNVDGSPLSAKDQVALDRSNKMVSDWNEQKEKNYYRSIIQSEMAKPFRNTRLIGEATDALKDKEQIAATRYTAELGALSEREKLGATQSRNNRQDYLEGIKFQDTQNQNDVKNSQEAQKMVIGLKEKGVDDPRTLYSTFRQATGKPISLDQLRMFAPTEALDSALNSEAEFVSLLNTLGLPEEEKIGITAEYNQKYK
jgi:hypothetical protein